MAAQQLLTVISARRSMESTFSLSGMSPLALDSKGLMVVTLNPEYKGRVSIPDNLTVCFRIGYEIALNKSKSIAQTYHHKKKTHHY